MPEVSVITAAYNSAGQIERTIRSVAAQSLRPLEHIIVDDGSADETAQLVRRLGQEFPHLKLICQEHSGAGAARNVGIEAAGGRYVAFIDSDDHWSETKLEAQIGFMKANDVAFSYGDYETVDEVSGASLGRHEVPERVSYEDLLHGCPIGCLTAAFDQSLLGKHFMPDVRRGQDWGLWLSLTRGGTVARRYPGCHAFYQQSTGSLSSGKLAKVADVYRIYREYEHIGTARTIVYMTSHVIRALTKRPVAGGAASSKRSNRSFRSLSSTQETGTPSSE